MANQPLQGIRILSMEQVVALPFATRHLADLDRHVALAATQDQIPTLLQTLGIDALSDLNDRLRSVGAEETAEQLQRVGIAASVVADCRDISTEVQLWSLGYFGHYADDAEATPQFGPAWGGGQAVAMHSPPCLGADNRSVLQESARIRKFIPGQDRSPLAQGPRP
jgi:crotonobetainyl-CoA:carnitine CoA-transferase CaiB-like acyl-CoA transferase